MCRDIQILWLAVMLVFEYDRESSSPRCCRGRKTGQAFECCAFGVPKAMHSERLWEKMREHSAWCSSWGEEQGISYGAPVFCRQIPFVGIAAEIRRGVAGEVWCLFGGVVTAVMAWVSSGFPGRSRGGISADLRGPPLNRISANRLKGGRGLGKGGGWGVWKAATWRHLAASLGAECGAGLLSLR